jgi:hypothetical protein
VSAVERRMQSLESRRAAIVQDQQRLRENMKALRGSAEEKELLQRYARQLNEQENRLESLQQEIAKATREPEAAREFVVVRDCGAELRRGNEIALRCLTGRREIRRTGG